MNRNIAPLLLALAIGAGALLLLLARKPTAPAPPIAQVATSSAAPAPTASAAPPVAAPSPSPKAEPTEAPPAPRGVTLRGRVVSAITGEPIEGAWVIQQDPFDPEVSALAETRTDAQGEYALAMAAHQHPDSLIPIVLRAEADGHASEARALGGDPDSRDPQDFVLVRGATVRGRVMDTAGKPIAGARVGIANGHAAAETDHALAHLYLYPEVTRTEADGAFELGGVPEGSELLLPASAPGYRTAVEGPIQAGATGVLFHMRPATASLHGTLYRGEGRDLPAPGVRILLSVQDLGDEPVGDLQTNAQALAGIQSAVTDGAGRFEFRGLPEDTAPFATVPGGAGIAWFRTEAARAPFAPGESRKADLHLIEFPRRTVDLTVVDIETSAPIGNVIMSPYRDIARSNSTMPRTDPRGKATAEQRGNPWLLPPPGWLPRMLNPWRDLEADPGQSFFRRGTVALRRGATLRGTVTDPEGRPAPGVAVRAEGLGETRTATDGAFAIGVPAGESVQVYFESAAGHAAVVFAPDAAREEQLVVLRPYASIAGTIRGTDGAPVSNAELRVVDGGDSPATAISDRDGRFRFPQLREGKVTLAGHGYRGSLKLDSPEVIGGDIVLAEGQRLSGVEVILHETRTLEVRFVDDADGSAVEVRALLFWTDALGETAGGVGYRSGGRNAVHRFRGVPGVATKIRIQVDTSDATFLSPTEFATFPESPVTVRVRPGPSEEPAIP